MKRWEAATVAAVVALIVGGCSSVSGGSAQVASEVVPDVVGMTEQDALHALSEAGNWPHVSRFVVSQTVPVRY